MAYKHVFPEITLPPTLLLIPQDGCRLVTARARHLFGARCLARCPRCPRRQRRYQHPPRGLQQQGEQARPSKDEGANRSWREWNDAVEAAEAAHQTFAMSSEVRRHSAWDDRRTSIKP